MKYFSIALIYISFFAFVAFIVWFTKREAYLFLLILTPTIRLTTKDKENDEK